MKKKFKLQNLECASCAAKMEDKISKIVGVNNVSINFITTRMTLEADKANIARIIEEAQTIIRKIEPDTKIVKA